jgi:hypothetical protein
MRKRYIQDPITYELIPAEEWRGPSVSKAAYIVPDIQPYQSMVDGSMIMSRSHHRSHLKQHGMVEIGNEINHHMKQAQEKRQPDKKAINRAVVEACRKHGFI